MNTFFEGLRLKFSRTYREKKNKEAEQERKAAWESRKNEVRASNIALMEQIVKNCPEGHAIFYKFSCGNWGVADMKEEAHKCLEAVKAGHRWGYLQGSGLGCIDPNHYHYQGDAERIVHAITTEPNYWLEGTMICAWRYVPMEK